MINFEINKVIEYWFFVLERNNEDESKEWLMILGFRIL